MSALALRVGIGHREMTPDHAVPLAGFAMRENRLVDRVDRRLSVRAWWFQLAHQRALLVVADVLWWGPDRVDNMKAAISDRFDIPPAYILLHATHTHSAPQTGFAFTESLGSPDSAWIAFFEQQTLAAIADAESDLAPCRLRRYGGSSGIGYNRRVALDEPSSPADSDGLVNRALTVITAESARGELRGTLVHHACHPTVTAGPAVSSEFPGIMAELLAPVLGPVTYVQGTCGDINPRITRGRPERDFADSDVAAVGGELAADVRRALASPGEDIDVDRLTVDCLTVDCRVRSVPSETELDAAISDGGLSAEWARALRRFPERCSPRQPLSMTALRLGDAIGFLAMSAEVTTAYGLAIETQSRGRLLPLGYTNGMTGYIVTDQQLANGGYEAEGSTIYFALPSQFAPGLEHDVMAGITRLIASKEPT